MPSTSRPAVQSGTFAIGGDLPVYRLGYGAMQLTGRGTWGEPADRPGRSLCCAAQSSLESI